MELCVGIKGSASCTVCPENTAAAVGSGALAVFSTPSMVALMEKAALESVGPCLEDGMTTVGIKLDIAHLAATPLNMEVRAESELVAIDGKMLSFEVRAYAGEELIGEGTHRRCIVNAERFMARTEAKAAK